MPRERPVHHPRAVVKEEDDDEDLGIYDDSDDGSSIDVDLPFITQSASDDDGKTPISIKSFGAVSVDENFETYEKAGTLVYDPLYQTTDFQEDLSKSDHTAALISRPLTLSQLPILHSSIAEEESDVVTPEIAAVSATTTSVPFVASPATTGSVAAAAPRDRARKTENARVERTPRPRPRESRPTFRQDFRAVGGRCEPPTNTPANLNQWSELKELESRLTGADSRRACYERAVSLLKTCSTSQLLVPSREQMMPAAGRCSQLGAESTAFFYIRQDKPIPMPPLKAWRGFHGNVYFEPIQVDKVPVSPTFSMPNKKQYHQTPSLSRSKTETSMRQMSMAILDRNRALRQSNALLHEDLTWIRGRASTGSLRTQNSYEKTRVPYNREKIHKGTVTKATTTTCDKKIAPLAVNGGQYIKPTSQLIRSQAQQTNSDQRRFFPAVNESNNSKFFIRNTETNANALVHVIPTRTPPIRTMPARTPGSHQRGGTVGYNYSKLARPGQQAVR